MRRSTKLMLMQEGQRNDYPERGEYSPRQDGRRPIGFDNERDYPTDARRRRDGRGRYADYPAGNEPNMIREWPEDSMPYWRDPPYMPPNMHGGRTIRGSGSFEMEYPQHGHARSSYGSRESETMSQPIDERTARMWVQRMDGGEHFDMQQAEELRHAVGTRCSPQAFYVALNMMYSDYSDVARQMGMDKKEYYAHMAKAFLEDADAKEYKLRRYMESIAK